MSYTPRRDRVVTCPTCGLLARSGGPRMFTFFAECENGHEITAEMVRPMVNREMEDQILFPSVFFQHGYDYDLINGAWQNLLVVGSYLIDNPQPVATCLERQNDGERCSQTIVQIDGSWHHLVPSACVHHPVVWMPRVAV